MCQPNPKNHATSHHFFPASRQNLPCDYIWITSNAYWWWIQLLWSPHYPTIAHNPNNADLTRGKPNSCRQWDALWDATQTETVSFTLSFPFFLADQHPNHDSLTCTDSGAKLFLCCADFSMASLRDSAYFIIAFSWESVSTQSRSSRRNISLDAITLQSLVWNSKESETLGIVTIYIYSS